MAAVAASPTSSSASGDGDVSSFVLQQSRLVALERADDIDTSTQSMQSMSEKDAVKAGLCIPRLVISDCKAGLYGRCLVTFVPERGDLLPATQIGVRDIVRIQPKAQQHSASQQWWKDGVVFRHTDRLVIVAVEEYPDVQQRLGSFSLTRLANEVVYQRYSAALAQLQEKGVYGHEGSRLLQVLYGGAAPSTQPSSEKVVVSPSGRSQRLNAVQVRAISRALSSNDVFVLHGPPGKTTTLVEMVVQCVARGQRVLACAPSNIAVDNLVERITAASSYNAAHAPKPSPSSPSSPTFHPFRCIRVGHPARLSPSVLIHSLDSVVASSDGGQITRDIEAELTSTQHSLNTTKDRSEKKTLYSQWKALQKELRIRQKKAVKDTLDGCSVICTTLLGAASSACAAYRYDVVVIDEAAQAIECACLIPILLCQHRLILAGDHRQLGPVVKSKEAESGGLGRTLMDRVAARADAGELMEMLDEQYRMNEDIMRWSSEEFYGGKLRAPEEVRGRRLAQLTGVKAGPFTLAPIVFIDTAGCDMNEDEEEEAGGSQAAFFAQSKSNQHEAALVLRHIKALLAAAVPLSSITVLSPYLAQISVLRDLLLPVYPTLEVGTIDSMQGRENDAIIISMVRSNQSGVVGFLNESRRMNVAVTRAKAHACIIGDSDTISKDRFLQRLVNYVAENEKAEYVSALEGEREGLVVEAPRSSPLPTPSTSISSAAEARRGVKAKAEPPPPVGSSAVRNEAEPAVVGAAVAAPVMELIDRERIVRLCEEVMRGDRESFTFPPSLTDSDRRLVHEVAEEVGKGDLLHSSEGKKHKRAVSLRKKPPPALSAALPTPSAAPAPVVSPASVSRPSSSSTRVNNSATVGRPSASTTAFSALREEQRLAAVARMEAAAKPGERRERRTTETTTATATSHGHTQSQTPSQPQSALLPVVPSTAIRGGQSSDEEGEVEEVKEDVTVKDEEKSGTALPSSPPTTSTATDRSPPSHSSPPPKAAKAKGGASRGKALVVESSAAEEDLDGFLESLSKGVSVCASPACSRPVMVNGAVCRYCGLRFCLAHCNGILHGCAADAKRDALARDLHSLHATQQGRSVSGLKDNKRQQLLAKVQQKASTARAAGEVQSKKKQQQGGDKKAP